MTVIKFSPPPGVLLSINQLATEIGTSRETLRSKLTEAGTAPAYVDGRRQLYRLRQVLAVWFADAASDTARMSPFARHAYFKAQHEEMRIAEKARQLIPVHEMQRALSEFAQTTVQVVATFPDQREMRGHPPSVVADAEEVVKQVRRAAATAVRALDDTPIPH